MEDEELYHAIVRAVRDVPADPKAFVEAVARVRKLIGDAPAREAKASRNRGDAGGQTRSAE